MQVKIGWQCKMYYLSTGDRSTFAADTANLTEIPDVGDLEVPNEMEEFEINIRRMGGFKAVVPTVRDVGLEFDLLKNTSDDGYTALQDAFLNRTSIALAILDGAKDADGTQGVYADFYVTKFGEPQNVKEGIVNKVRIAPAPSDTAPEDVEVSVP